MSKKPDLKLVSNDPPKEKKEEAQAPAVVQRKLKVCIISTTVIVCPPPGYSGLEQIAWLHAQGLARRGHDVLLVAPIGSKPPDGVELHGTTLGESEGQAFSGYQQRLKDYGVIIDHSWQKFSYIWKAQSGAKTPILGFLHAPCNTMYNSPPPVAYPCFVAISKDQAFHASELWGVNTRVCYHGLDENFYRSNGAIRGDRYLFLGRMSTIKGPHIAVDVARKTRIPLDLVGDDTITGEPQLAQRLMAQADGNLIKYIGPIPRDKTVEYYSTRKCLLHCNLHYREPFGLAPVEAQLAGMPVIAFDNGAMRETIKHGETGFIVKTQEEMEKLVKEKAVEQIKPERCREWASQFSIKAMIDQLEKLCREALETGGW